MAALAVNGNNVQDDETLRVEVLMEYEKESWSRQYNVQQGQTVLQFKRSMMDPANPMLEEDAISFDLRTSKARMSNLDVLKGGEILRLVYLGSKDGAKKLQEDKVKKEEAEAAAERLRDYQEFQARMKGAADAAAQEARAAAEAAPAPAGDKSADISSNANNDEPAAPLIDVTIRNLREGTTITVQVPSTANILLVRQTVCEAVGGNCKLDDIKLVKKEKFVWKPIPNDEPVGTRKEIFSQGHNLVRAVKAESMINFRITSKEDDEAIEVAVPGDVTLLDVKKVMCEKAKRGIIAQVQLLSSTGIALLDKDVASSISSAERSQLKASGVRLGPPCFVDVRVVHRGVTVEGLAERSVTVMMEDTATFLELRKEVARVLGGEFGDVKLLPPPRRTCRDEDRLNGCTEVGAYGNLMDTLRPDDGTEDDPTKARLVLVDGNWKKVDNTA